MGWYDNQIGQYLQSGAKYNAPDFSQPFSQLAQYGANLNKEKMEKDKMAQENAYRNSTLANANRQLDIQKNAQDYTQNRDTEADKAKMFEQAGVINSANNPLIQQTFNANTHKMEQKQIAGGLNYGMGINEAVDGINHLPKEEQAGAWSELRGAVSQGYGNYQGYKNQEEQVNKSNDIQSKLQEQFLNGQANRDVSLINKQATIEAAKLVYKNPNLASQAEKMANVIMNRDKVDYDSALSKAYENLTPKTFAIPNAPALRPIDPNTNRVNQKIANDRYGAGTRLSNEYLKQLNDESVKSLSNGGRGVDNSTAQPQTNTGVAPKADDPRWTINN